MRMFFILDWRFLSNPKCIQSCAGSPCNHKFLFCTSEAPRLRTAATHTLSPFSFRKPAVIAHAAALGSRGIVKLYMDCRVGSEFWRTRKRGTSFTSPGVFRSQGASVFLMYSGKGTLHRADEKETHTGTHMNIDPLSCQRAGGSFSRRDGRTGTQFVRPT